VPERGRSILTGEHQKSESKNASFGQIFYSRGLFDWYWPIMCARNRAVHRRGSVTTSIVAGLYTWNFSFIISQSWLARHGVTDLGQKRRGKRTSEVRWRNSRVLRTWNTLRVVDAIRNPGWNSGATKDFKSNPILGGE